jgi:hypothetical protein
MEDRPLAGRQSTWQLLMIAVLAIQLELGCQRPGLITPILKTTVQVAIMVLRREGNPPLTFKLPRRANPVTPLQIHLLGLLNSTTLVLRLVVQVAIMVKLLKANLLVIFQQVLFVSLVTRLLAFWEQNLITAAPPLVVQAVTMVLLQKEDLLVTSQPQRLARLAIRTPPASKQVRP